MNAEAENGELQFRTVGEIAATLPGATAVFRKLKIDFYCGGGISLIEAADQHGIDPAEIEAQLSRLQTGDKASTVPAEPPALVDYIVTRFHQTHRRELPELIKLARKVEAVHESHPQVPAGLAELLHVMAGKLEIHMKKEELILFPSMKRDRQGLLAAPISQMRLDHDDHGAHLRRIDEITGGLTLPQDACHSWQALYAGVRKLADDLMEHINLENNILFPMFEAPRAS